MGDALQGSVSIQLPNANDGNDLQVHLNYESMPESVEPVVEEEVKDAEDSESVPFLTTLATATTLLGAAWAHAGKINQRDLQGRRMQ